MRYILGSASPRRAEILRFFTLPFEQISSNFNEEEVPFLGDPIGYATQLSEGKSFNLTPQLPDSVIITADTVVYKEGKIFNKPKDAEEALSFLQFFSGSWHSVFTSVTVGLNGHFHTKVEESRILFNDLSGNQIKKYHNAFLSLDKAGGYGIQDAGALIVKKIDGCFYNVMGLPINTLRELLLKVEVDLWNYL